MLLGLIALIQQIFSLKIISKILGKLKKIGAKIKTSKDKIHIQGPKKIKFGLKFLIIKFPFAKVAATQNVPVSILSPITEYVV